MKICHSEYQTLFFCYRFTIGGETDIFSVYQHGALCLLDVARKQQRVWNSVMTEHIFRACPTMLLSKDFDHSQVESLGLGLE